MSEESIEGHTAADAAALDGGGRRGGSNRRLDCAVERERRVGEKSAHRREQSVAKAARRRRTRGRGGRRERRPDEALVLRHLEARRAAEDVGDRAHLRVAQLAHPREREHGGDGHPPIVHRRLLHEEGVRSHPLRPQVVLRLRNDPLGEALAPHRAARRRAHELRARRHRLVEQLRRRQALRRRRREQRAHGLVRSHEGVERRVPVLLGEELQVDVAVVVRVGEEALERVAHEHAQRLRAHARAVARQLDRLRRPRHQAVADDADATVGPHCLTERTVVEHRRDRQPAVAKHARVQLRRARQAVVEERLELRDDLLDGAVVHGHILAEDGVDARERRHGDDDGGGRPAAPVGAAPRSARDPGTFGNL